MSLLPPLACFDSSCGISLPLFSQAAAAGVNFNRLITAPNVAKINVTDAGRKTFSSWQWVVTQMDVSKTLGSKHLNRDAFRFSPRSYNPSPFPSNFFISPPILFFPHAYFHIWPLTLALPSRKQLLPISRNPFPTDLPSLRYPLPTTNPGGAAFPHHGEHPYLTPSFSLPSPSCLT